MNGGRQPISISVQPPPATQECQQSLEQLLCTPNWHTISMLHCPAAIVTLNHIERPTPEPEAARSLRVNEWNERVTQKCAQLAQVNPNKVFETAPDASGQLTLYEVVEGQRVPRMWDGTTISTAATPRQDENGNFVLDVFPIKYSEWTSCTNPEFGAAYRVAGLPLPNAGVGISVLMETNDGFIPLTRRGIETPVYPGQLYSPGGGPKVGQDSVQAILEEILEETGLRESVHFNADELVMLAYVSDTKHQETDHERPELVAYLPLTISIREVCDIRAEYLKRKRVPETDVWAYDIVPSDMHDLRGKIVLQGNEMCPPTEAALTHLVHYKNTLTIKDPTEAFAQTQSFMQRVNSYGRGAYQPPIHKLAR